MGFFDRIFNRPSPSLPFPVEAKIRSYLQAKCIPIRNGYKWRYEEINCSHPGLNGTSFLEIWTEPLSAFQYVTMQQRMSVSSNNVNDTAAGTGAWKLWLLGLDENYLEIDETIDLNGTTPVLTRKRWIRINRAIVTDSGNPEGLLGTISIIPETQTGRVQGRILPGDNVLEKSHYTVPDNHVAVVMVLSGELVTKAQTLNVSAEVKLCASNGQHFELTGTTTAPTSYSPFTRLASLTANRFSPSRGGDVVQLVCPRSDFHVCAKMAENPVAGVPYLGRYLMWVVDLSR